MFTDSLLHTSTLHTIVLTMTLASMFFLKRRKKNQRELPIRCQSPAAARVCARLRKNSYIALYRHIQYNDLERKRPFPTQKKGVFGMTMTRGHCYLCGRELSKGGIRNHLLKTHAESSGEECVLLKIEGAYNKDYWLYVDAAKDSKLKDLDDFLREIWLECCGHMSAFYIGWKELKMSTRLVRFSPGDKLRHEYDFGSTTECLVTVIGPVWRKPQKKAVRLLARNSPPALQCCKCGAPARHICTACMWESDHPFYCDACLKQHTQEEPDHDEMDLPVTNSPRMGVCGYCGELDCYEFIPPESKA